MATSQLAAINSAIENAPPSSTANVPVRFYIVLSDDGLDGMSNASFINEAYINSVLGDLSAKYSTHPDFNFSFELCGEINYIHNSAFQNGLMPVHEYAHVNQAANVYVTADYDAARADFPWLTGINNKISIRRDDYDLLYPTLSHEFGHHFGLYHTFEPERFYNVPNPTGPILQEDHPYNLEASGHPRELVIRSYDGSQDFPTPNHYGAPYNGFNDPRGGDLVGDTPAGCRTYANGGQTALNFPGCSFNAISCTYNGTYVDYNGMAIDDPTNILAKNIMSYNTGACRQEFVDGQIERAFGYYLDIREHQYWSFFPEESCGNIDDRVEFEDTDVGQDRVFIEYVQGGQSSKSLTSPDGDFDGILFIPLSSTSASANVEKLGPNSDFTFNYEDWKDGVTSYDLLLISQHILGTTPSENGYKHVAADVSNNGLITTFDL